MVYLTKDELEHLAAEPRLARVRDLFVLACTTGLRHFQLSTVRPDQVKSDQLVVRTVKTRDWLYVDLNCYSRVVLQRYLARRAAALATRV